MHMALCVAASNTQSPFLGARADGRLAHERVGRANGDYGGRRMHQLR
jgi:hypothetical protein